MQLKIKKLTEDATIPVRAYTTDAGLDLYANEDVIIAPGETKVVKTGIAIQLPENTVGDVRPRSGVTSKTKLRVANAPGTVDEGYTGEVGVIFDNIWTPEHGYGKADISEKYISPPVHTNSVEYHIKKGDKIAQLVILPIIKPEVIEVDSLNESERGKGGFGSTGA